MALTEIRSLGLLASNTHGFESATRATIKIVNRRPIVRMDIGFYTGRLPEILTVTHVVRSTCFRLPLCFW